MKVIALIFSFFILHFSAQAQDKINWISFNQGVESQSNNPKFIFIDLYTDWCSWCKVMDRTTFQDPQVVSFFKNRYHNVKFNAESQDSVQVLGRTFCFVPERRMHELALSLFNGQDASFPSFVILSPNFEYVGILQGFQKTDEFLKNLSDMEARYWLGNRDKK